MNKTIKQAERYVAPETNVHVFSARTCFLQTSGSNEGYNYETGTGTSGED